MSALTGIEDHHDHWLPVPGGILFVREWPGPARGKAPIILLHDSLGCVELWREFPAHLAGATGRRVIAYDRLGFGKSGAHAGVIPPDFVTQECARTLPSLLAALAIERFALFGHSVGGGMALAGAAAFGTRCAAVMTEAAQVFAETRTLDGVRAARAIFAHGNTPYERLKKYHGDKTDWVLSAWIDTWLDPNFANFSLAPCIGHLQSPALAMHGDRDEYGTTRHAQLIGELSPAPVTVNLLSGCGHIPHREKTDLVLEAVAAVLCSVD